MTGFLIAATLIALNYKRIWHDWLKMPKPFTYVFCEWAVSSPWAWWGGVALFFILSFLTAYFGESWQRILGICWTGFFAWFCPHILQNIQVSSVIWKMATPKYDRLVKNLRWFGIHG